MDPVILDYWARSVMFVQKWWLHITIIKLLESYVVYSVIRVRVMYKSWTGCWKTGDWLERTEYFGPIVSYPATFFSLQCRSFFGPQEE